MLNFNFYYPVMEWISRKYPHAVSLRQLIELFHSRGLYHMETIPLTCSAHHCTGFYMIGTSIMKELIVCVWFSFQPICHIVNFHNLTSSVIRQKSESQNGCFKKTKHSKFSKKWTYYHHHHHHLHHYHHCHMNRSIITVKSLIHKYIVLNLIKI